MLRRERSAYNETHRNRNEIQELRLQLTDSGQTLDTATQAVPLDAITVSPRSQMSQVTASHSVMGGRNEQAHNQRIAAVITRRHLRSTVARTFSDPAENTSALNECDSNADTCCLGKIFCGASSYISHRGRLFV